MIEILILTAVYLLGVIAAYFTMRAAYSKGGAFDSFDAGFGDVLMIFVPFWNIMFSMIYWILVFSDGKFNFNKFFKVKR